MSGSKANVYKEWFLKGEKRELDPLREVVEELVDETGLLPKEELEGLKYEKIGYATQLSETWRVGYEGKMTLRFAEVFDIKFKPETLQKLVALSEQKGALIHFVTEKEIENEKTTDGVKIGIVAKCLIDFQNTIAEFK